jgi:2-keto-4-pentenoate hydratase
MHRVPLVIFLVLSLHNLGASQELQEHAKYFERLFLARSSAKIIENIPPAWKPTSATQAYALQSTVDQQFMAIGRRVAGYKIAFTNEKSQLRWGLNEPAFAPLFEDDQVADHAKTNIANIDSKDFCLLHVEAEIVFKLKSAITKVPDNQKDLIQHVATVHLGFDIPDLRFSTEQGWPTGYELIADSLGAHAWMIGEGIDQIRFDPAIQVELHRNDQLYSKGLASEVLGSPWQALSWLANKKIEQGQPLQPGQVIFTGPPGKAYLPKTNRDAPGNYEARAAGLPAVRLQVK